MSYEGGRPRYYQEDHEYSLYYQNELQDYAEPNFSSLHDPYSPLNKNPVILPTIDYLNERKCPIYRHYVPHDSSVYNNYGQKLATPRKSVEVQKIAGQNSSKFVLDKLEETYWATWKPKKENMPVKKKSPQKFPNTGLTESKLQLKNHNKGNKKTLNKPHGDVNDSSIFKYFKAEEFESSTASVVPKKSGKRTDSSSTSVSAINENIKINESKKRLNRPRRFVKVNQRDSVSQEIQTVVHCPVILEQIKENNKEVKKLSSEILFKVIFENDMAPDDENLESPGDKEEKIDTNKVNKKDSKTQKQEETKNQEEGKSKTEGKVKNFLKSKKAKKVIHEPKKASLEETQNNPDSLQTFVEIKDSIDIAKEKQIQSSKEHYQQPKCIRLYRKAGGTSSVIKGGTYPLKSCLKKDSFPKGNFRLGAPGSPLFVTTSSFSGKRKK